MVKTENNKGRIGLYINVRDGKKRMPLYIAARESHRAIVWILIKLGADVEARNSREQTLLY